MTFVSKIAPQSIPFQLNSKYQPNGDQPQAIEKLTFGIEKGLRDQVLLGVTGSGKTFTMANIIVQQQKPTIIMAPNKTLAAQLFMEMKEFFPHNAVEYFVSYYDYYQPEAYIAKTDTFIEKDAVINEDIDTFRNSATRSLLERRDVIVVSSVSSIYGLGSPEIYSQMIIIIEKGQYYKRQDFLNNLIKLRYERNDTHPKRGQFSVRGDRIDLIPAYSDGNILRVDFFDDEIEQISEVDGLLKTKLQDIDKVVIYPNGHYATPQETLNGMISTVLDEMKAVSMNFHNSDKLLESQRIQQRTKYDMEMVKETGSCKGIENYSCYLTGRPQGSPPPTLFEYIPKDALLFVDESHIGVPQIRGMFNGDRARKTNLVEHGFRLPSALNNRPLKFEEWDAIRPQTIYVSATPGPFEMEKVNGEVVEQVIRPTGLLDPICEVRKTEFQVDDIINEIGKVRQEGLRTIVITLTKKMAEDLARYLEEIEIPATYLHSDIDTITRIETIQKLRTGEIDVLVGINLLREGIDIPECGLVAIMDADKEGFLRSESSLIQIIGRAARNSDGRVILYADKETKSIKKALEETNRRRQIQIEHNEKNGITPTTVKRSIEKDFNEFLSSKPKGDKRKRRNDIIEEAKLLSPFDLDKLISNTKKQMQEFADNLELEKAIKARDELHKLQEIRLLRG